MSSLLGITHFLTTASSGSFAAAALSLGVSAVAVSKNVSNLERQLGVRLLNRSTRALSLTEEGRRFEALCEAPLRALNEALQGSQKSTLTTSGRVQMTCISPVALGFVIPMLQKFYALHPKIQVVLHLDDTVKDLVKNAFDLGVRVGIQPPDSVIARKISPLDFVVAASSSYLSNYGAPKTLEDLAQHNCVQLKRTQKPLKEPNNSNISTQSSDADAYWRVGHIAQANTVAIRSNLIVNDFNALEQAALKHIGLVQAPLPLLAPHFRSGLLRPVLPQAVLTGLNMYLYYRSRKYQPARVQVLIDYLLADLRAQPDLQADTKALCAPYWA